MQFFSASFAKNPKQTLFHTTLGWVCVCVSQGKNLDNVGDGGKGGGQEARLLQDRNLCRMEMKIGKAFCKQRESGRRGPFSFSLSLLSYSRNFSLFSQNGEEEE